MYSNDTDMALFAALATTGETAFRKLCDRYYASLFSICLVKLKQNELAQEVVMDCLMMLWNQREEVARMEHPGQWLYQTAYRLAAAARRRQQQHKKYTASSTEIIIADNAVLHHLEKRDVRLLFDEAMARLTRQQQAIIQLTLEGANRKHIARQLQISEKTVRNHITGSFRRLRWLLWEMYQQ